MAIKIASGTTVNFGSDVEIDSIAGPMTMCFWYKRAANTATNNFWSKGANFRFRDDSGTVANEVRFLRIGYSSIDFDVVSNHTFTAAMGWVHWALVIGITGIGSIYKNAAQSTYRKRDNADPVGTPPTDAASDLTFTGSTQTGELAEFAIWKRELTPSEIHAIYRGMDPRNLAVSRTSLIRYCPLGGGQTLAGTAGVQRDFSPYGRLVRVTSGTASPHPIPLFERKFNRFITFVEAEAEAANTNITPSVGAITITGASPVDIVDVRIAPTTGTITITGATPVDIVAIKITTTVGALSLAPLAPTLFHNCIRGPPEAALALTGTAPIVQIFAPTSLTPTTGVATISGLVPVCSIDTRIDTHTMLKIT